MIKARTSFTLLMISLGTIAATASCGSDEATGSGAGAGGTAGGGIIGGGGANGRAGAVGRAGSSPVGDAGTGGVSSGFLGTTCAIDSDCGDGLTCITSDSTAFGSGGPSNGMCTLACSTDADCTPAEPNAGCVTFSDKSYCLESCTQGEPAEVNSKCQGRQDFVCVDLADHSKDTATVAAPPAPFCVPLCLSDADCGAGSFCDPRGGLCTKTKPTGEPVGTACDPNAATDPCEDFCITTSATGVTPVTGACVALCSGELPCMYNGIKPGGLCVVGDNLGAFDLGVCQPNCECPADCKIPGDVCRAWSSSVNDQQLKTALGADGLCFPNVTGSVALDCGEGGAPGTAGAGG